MNRSKVLKYGGGILVLLIYFFISLYLPNTSAPDETLRYDIPQFIFWNGYLPTGTETELLDDIWGFSYAIYPYLPSLISVVFMKMTALFTTSPDALLVAARFSCVLAGAGTWVVCFCIGEKLFKSDLYAVLLSAFCCLLPQFAFLSSYLNNDSWTVFCSAIIVYAWIIGIQENWNRKSCIYLGIGIGMLSLTYYNAFGFILCSLFVYFITAARKQTAKELWSKAFLIFIIAFLIGGWFYIRNFIIHDGDFIGMNTLNALGEANAQDLYKPSLRQNPKNLGMSLSEAFFGIRPGFFHNWFVTTYESFIGVFKYMNVYLPSWTYVLYTIIFVIGLIGCVWFVIKPDRDVPLNKTEMICLLLCILIPIALSMYYSYASDYQPQGRYVMPALLPFMLFVTTGIYKLNQWIKQRFRKAACLPQVSLALYSVLFVYSIYGYLILQVLDFSSPII